MASTGGERIGQAGPETEESRRMCFSQGKAFVYEPEDEQDTIVTEWPNGVIDRHDLKTRKRVRHWPDGTTDSRHEDEPVEYPMWPRPAAVPRNAART